MTVSFTRSKNTSINSKRWRTKTKFARALFYSLKHNLNSTVPVRFSPSLTVTFNPHTHN